jgi:hypothetical protein
VERPRERILVVQCVDDINGMDVLESVAISIEHPAIQDILGQGRDAHNNADTPSRLVIVEDQGIDNDTTDSESETDYIYTQRFLVRRHATFSLVREDLLFDDMSLSGKIFKSDDVSEIPITVTDTI